MNNAALADVVEKIADAVEAFGLRHQRSAYRDRASWLRERASILRSRDIERIVQARHELSQIIHGMGGLLDIPFDDEWEEVELLIDQLWAEVEPYRAS